MKTPVAVSSTSSLPDVLRMALAAADISAAELARKSGVSVATLSRILAGRVNPSLSNMAKIARVLGVSMDSLVPDTQTSAPQLPRVALDARAVVAPAEHALIATFVLENTDHTPADAAKLITNAAVGSWVATALDRFVPPDVPTPKVLNSQAAGSRRVSVDIAFPADGIEEGSVVSLLSPLAAVITSTGAKVADIVIPHSLTRTFQGPSIGMQGLRDLAGKYGRPLLSASLRPMMGLSPRLYGRTVFEILRGGVDMTCDPSMLHSIPSNRWRDRFRFVADAVHAAGSETGEYKLHGLNITAGTVDEMIERAEYAADMHMSAVLIDSGTIGWAATHQMARYCAKNSLLLCAMGGRSLQGGVLSEVVLARLLRLCGADVVSIGSPLRGGTASRRQVKGLASVLRDAHIHPQPENGVLFAQNASFYNTCVPAVGGGHNPWHFPQLMDALGDDVLIQCGGSVMGHPWGSSAGATANRVAVEALVLARGEGQSLAVDGRGVLQRAMRHSAELKAALEYWQEGAFLFGVIKGDKKDISAVVLQPTPLPSHEDIEI